MTKPETRLIVGTLVTSGTSEPNWITTLLFDVRALVFSAYGGREPDGLDITISLEGVPKEPILIERMEIVFGTLEMMQNTLAKAVKDAADRVSKNPAKKKGPKPTGAFFQVAVGSKAFCETFIRYWAATVNKESARDWEYRVLKELATAQPGDTVWFDVLKPEKITRDKTRQMVERNIGMMVM